MTAVVDGYRLARQAQDERFNTRPGAGCVDASLTGSEEYRQYFGLGEFAGGGVEPRVTFKGWLQASAEPAPPEQELEPESRWVTVRAAFYLPGDVLLEAAGLGDPVAAWELERRRAKRAAKRAGKS